MQTKYSRPEIERRWLVDLALVGALDGLPVRRIVDRYLLGTGLRLRRVEGERPSETVLKLGKKEGGQLTNIYLSEAEYDLLAALPAEVLIKRRYAVAEGSLDLPEGPLPPRWEREFDSEEEAAAFIPPHFVTEEDLGP